MLTLQTEFIVICSHAVLILFYTHYNNDVFIIKEINVPTLEIH
jgi:hypothetical protein